MSGKQDVGITDEVRQAVRKAHRYALQQDLRTLAANIRDDARSRHPHAEAEWRSGVEWALLWIENTANSLAD
ncbi:hypothetical protein ACGFYA_29805 [Streptomyces sp. NPDC048305]|uniref:hypothetical protein n=1 Tax=Streptomyces sp. NPDC048305 TaxID=3365532 RepID=UPI0037236002